MDVEAEFFLEYLLNNFSLVLSLDVLEIFLLIMFKYFSGYFLNISLDVLWMWKQNIFVEYFT